MNTDISIKIEMTIEEARKIIRHYRKGQKLSSPWDYIDAQNLIKKHKEAGKKKKKKYRFMERKEGFKPFRIDWNKD